MKMDASDADLNAVLTAAAGQEIRQRAIIGANAEARPGLSDRARGLLDEGLAAVRKVRGGGLDAVLSPAEQTGLEAVVLLTERPALLVQKDNFPMPADPWKILDKPHRAPIRRTLPSVGRIEITSGGQRRMNGTGFLVGGDLLLTNRHVVAYPGAPAIHFGVKDPSGKWKLIGSRKPTIDFMVEHGVAGKREFRIVDIVAMHDKFDMALLRVASEAEGEPKVPLPKPVKIASEAPAADAQRLYTVGYPAADESGRTPPVILEEIFGGIFAKKRLSPGELMVDFPEQGLFAHDCTTLGGNSGSCVVDLAADRVVGLHFSGAFKDQNDAVALWRLANDPFFAANGVEFD